MQTRLKVSVVIPAYNEEKFLPSCLQSLMEQTVKAGEIIVVDNNSSDRTAEIAAKFGAKVVKERKQGISYARNAGFDAASGDVIARCDADSVLLPDWIEKIGQDFEKGNIIGVTGPCYFYDFKGKRGYKKMPKMLHTALFFKSSKFVLRHEILFGSNMALSKNAWLKIRNEVCSNEKKFHEDMDLASHLSKYGTIQYDPYLIATISARRVRSVKAYVDYPFRWYKSIRHGRKIRKKKKSSSR